MTLEKYFYGLVSGQQSGITAATLRGGLRMLEIPYSAVVLFRNFLYDRRILTIREFPVPLISVGNLTLGGTGKSPMTAWLCRYFLQQGLRPGLVSRGYKKLAAGQNDEYLEMLFRFPAVPHVQNRNRAAAAEELLRQNNVDVIILDDAFQHRRLDRQLDIVLIDATLPFGFEHLFPRGTLREPAGGLKRADAAVLSRAGLIAESERQKIKERILSFNPNLIWAEAGHIPTEAVSLLSGAANHSAGTQSAESLRGKTAFAFCGIGNPSAFRFTLEQCGVHVIQLLPFPDHYCYTVSDVERILRTANELGTETVLCTMKDFVKLTKPEFYPLMKRATLPIQAVSIELRLTVGEMEIRKRLESLFPFCCR